MLTPLPRFTLAAAVVALPLFGAERPPTPPLQGRIIVEHEAQIDTIYCGALQDCSIQAPNGERFVRRGLGDSVHFLDSPEDAFPTPFYTIKASYAGFATSLHLFTDKDNQYSFRIEDPGKGPTDYTIILKSGDASIDRRIAGPSNIVSRAEYELEVQKRIAAEMRADRAEIETRKKVEDASLATERHMEAQVQTYQFDREQAKHRPWEIGDIYRIGDITYIKRTTSAQDLPTVNVTDPSGKHTEIVVPKYDPDRGLYKIAQRVNDGFFSFGGQKHEKKLPFHLPEGS